MPVMDGFEATRKIRQYEASISASPVTIVALTAGVGLGYEETAMAAGMNDYMNKPFTSEQLFRMLERYLSNNRYQESAEIEEPETQQPTKADERAAASERNTDNALIDFSVFESIQELERNTGRDIFSRVLATFEKEMSQKMTEMNGFVEQGDSQEVSRMSHAMKSLCGNVGAKLLRELCSDMEAASKEQNIVSYKASHDEFNAKYSSTLQSLKSIVSKSNE